MFAQTYGEMERMKRPTLKASPCPESSITVPTTSVPCSQKRRRAAARELLAYIVRSPPPTTTRWPSGSRDTSSWRGIRSVVVSSCVEIRCETGRCSFGGASVRFEVRRGRKVDSVSWVRELGGENAGASDYLLHVIPPANLGDWKP